MSEEKKTRPEWDEYFMTLARHAATRSTCDRKHVGAVIIRNKMVLSTGYNGSPRGLPHCDDVGHNLKEMGGRHSCVATIHAEMNAIAQAARAGTAIEGATIYVTASPCFDCMKTLINAGIESIICGEMYGSRYGLSDEVPALAAAAGIKMKVLKPAEAA